MKCRTILTVQMSFWFFFGVIASAQTEGIDANLECGMIATGGSFYSLLEPDYDEITLRRYSCADGSGQDIYRVQSPPFQYVELSKSCEYVAFREASPRRDGADLRIITTKGAEIRLISNVYAFTWGSAPQHQDFIAFIRGDYDDDGYGFKSKGTWVMNLESGEEWQIHPRGYVLAWAEFDASIYIWDIRDREEPNTKVQRYDFETKKLEKTPYHGMDFSLGGTFYHTGSYNEQDFQLFDRVTNIDVTEQYAKLFEPFIGSRAGWLSDSKLLLTSRPASPEANLRRQRIIDFKEMQVWEMDPEVVGFADRDEKTLVLLVNGKVVKRNFEEAARLVYPPTKDEGVPETAEKER